MQVQLLTVLVRLEELPPAQVRDVYKLLLDDSHAVRHAAAELVTDMLEESGQRHLAQVVALLTFNLASSSLPYYARNVLNDKLALADWHQTRLLVQRH